MNLTRNLTLKECTKSATAIAQGWDNLPTPEEIENIKLWAINIFQPIRSHFGVPIGLSSMYRSPILNKKIGGAKSSQHTKGQAGDIDADIYGHITNKEIFDFVRTNLDFDQMIIYNSINDPDFVHVSYKKTGNRNEILFKNKNGYHKL